MPSNEDTEELRLLHLEAEVKELRSLWQQNEELFIKLKVAYESHSHDVDVDLDGVGIIEATTSLPDAVDALREVEGNYE